jgi:chaperone required for assembly of F1-ATPase
MTDETEEERIKRLSRDTYKRPLLKRFYKSVEVSDALGILLDGRAIKTPLKKPLVMPSRAMAEAVAEEWQAQVEVVNPALMPVTKLANTAIDRATSERASVVDEIVQYAGSDLVCYWADRPPQLVQLQRQHWQPVLDWAAESLDATFKTASGISHVEQDEAAMQAIRNTAERLDEWNLTAMFLLTTMLGSALISLRMQSAASSADAAWAAANVDEDYQISQWGEDWEAKIRRESRAREYQGMVKFLELLAHQS